VCEKKFVRKIVVLKEEEITGRRTRLNNEEFRELVSSTAVASFMNLNRVVRLGMWRVWRRIEMIAKFLWENLRN
jgi:hypothetical protein